MNKAAQFIRKHALAILVVAVALAVPFGVASAKYTTTKTVSDSIEVNVNVKTYTIDKAKLRAQFDALTPANVSTPPTAIKFVKGSDAAIQGLTSVTEDGVQADGSGKIGVFVSGTTLYIAPMEEDSSSPASTVNAAMFAPADSSSLLSGFSIPDDTATPAVVGTCINTIDCSNLNTSKVTTMKDMFLNDGVLTTLVFGDMFTTSNVTDMSYTFAGLSNLTNLDISSFNTAKVQNMNSMFATSPGLKKITLGSSFNTSNVTNMEYMFFCCYDLQEVDVSMFDTSKITSTFEMFSGCDDLTTLDLSSFDTSNVTKMDNMFDGCFLLKTIYASDKFVTSQVTSSTNMFDQCNSLVGGNNTTCNGSSNIDASYAHIDVAGNPGYFTGK